LTVGFKTLIFTICVLNVLNSNITYPFSNKNNALITLLEED